MRQDLISKKVKDVPPSGIRKFFDLILTMDDVISLGVGEPDFTTPWHIRERSIHSLESGHTTYTSNKGLLKLREEVASSLEKSHRLSYDPEEEILITTGVSEGLDLALRALINPGDEIIIPEPCYVSYAPCTIFADGRPVGIATRVEDGFKVRPSEIKDALTSRTKAILLCYPNNPTGASLGKEELGQIAEVIRENDLIVITDEIYRDLTYEGEHTSIASLPGMKERTLILDGFSKAYAMTGFRIGYAAGPEEIISAMTKIHQYTMLCAPILSQKAAIEALKEGEEEKRKMIATYRKRKNLIVNGLNSIGLSCLMPEGAFYAFASVKDTGLACEEFSEQLLKQEKVATVPGTAFGKCGEGFIRCSYATSTKVIEEALKRMERFLT
ncbi:aminotransferase class I/II-fold pyridoxal phosphate-dependent enzyme [bacterium]|nr:aminotransferase class I/II-fold pyridoxal phosphate-dependent enzyme [bacterium]